MSESQFLAVLDSKGNRIRLVNENEVKKGWEDQWKKGLEVNFTQLSGNMTQPMRQSYIVQRAIQMIADTMPLAPLNFYRGVDEIKPDHPLRTLFKRPTQNTSYFELMYSTAMYFKMCGEVFWYVAESRGQAAGISNIPAEIIVLNPYKIKEVLTDQRMLKGWLYDNKIALTLDEVIQIKSENPYNPYRGLSPMDSIAFDMRADYKSSEYQEKFFENGAIPGFVLKTHPEDNTPEKDLERYGKLWDQHHKGVSKSHKTAVLRGGMDFKVVGLSQKQMNFIETRVMNRDVILQLIGVPKSVFGATEDVNRATAEYQEKSFWQNTIRPIILRIEAKINSHIVHFADPSITARFDLTKIPVLQNLYSDDVESAWKLFQIGFARNELNERFDFGFRNDPTTGNDKYVMMNLINVEGDSRFPETLAELDGKQVKKIEIKEIKQAHNHKLFLRMHRPIEKQLQKKLYNYFEMQKRVVLGKLTNNKADSNLTFKEENYIELYNRISTMWDKENKILVEAVTPILGSAVEAGQKYADATLGTQRDIILNQTILSRKVNQITGINNTIFNEIKKQIRNGLSEGETVDDIAERVKGVYSTSKERALRIARTETTSAMSEATLVEYQQAGVPGVEWLTAGDENVRPEHQANAAAGAIRTGSTFPNGEKFPSAVNCRCSLSPVVR